MFLNVYTDGGSRGNHGPAACAFVVYDDAGNLREKSGKYLGIATNNYAEYQGVIEALDHIPEKATQVNFYLDSLLVVSQLNGKWKVKDENIKELVAKIQFKILNLKFKISFVHIPREKNFQADKLVNETLDHHQ